MRNGFGPARLILSVLDDDCDPRHSPDVFTNRNVRMLAVVGGQDNRKGMYVCICVRHTNTYIHIQTYICVCVCVCVCVFFHEYYKFSPGWAVSVVEKKESVAGQFAVKYKPEKHSWTKKLNKEYYGITGYTSTGRFLLL